MKHRHLKVCDTDGHVNQMCDGCSGLRRSALTTCPSPPPPPPPSLPPPLLLSWAYPTVIMAENIYSKGTRVWFPDKELGWISAEVSSLAKTDDNVKLVFVDERGKVGIPRLSRLFSPPASSHYAPRVPYYRKSR